MFGKLTKSLKSIDLNGNDERVHYNSKYANRITPSPDNKWIVFSNLHKAYLAPFVNTGQAIELDAKSKAFPVTQITKDAGINLHWSNDSKKVHWTLGDEYFTNEIENKFTFLSNSPDSISPISETGLKIGLESKTAVPQGQIALENVRIITMEGGEVIENGTIVIKENKIVAIGKSNEIEVPKSAKSYDLSGKTVMPGIVDAHAHIGAFRYGISPKNTGLYMQTSPLELPLLMTLLP